MEITVRCPSGREQDVSVRCQADWRVFELKQHLSEVYPGQPAADTQRIVFAGRLLSNEEPLGQALGGQTPSRIVHLVLPGGAAASPNRCFSAPAMTQSPAAAVPTSTSSVSASSEELAQMWREYSQYVHSHYRDCLLNRQPQQQQQPQPQPIPIAPDPAADADEADVDGAIVLGGRAGGIREWFHIAVRCALMSIIIFYYSSGGKAVSAFVIFFVMQAIQGGFFHRLLVRNPPAADAAPAAVAPAAPVQAETPEGAEASTNPQTVNAQQQPPRAATLTETLAAILDALLTALVTFVTSLVPERPPPLANQ